MVEVLRQPIDRRCACRIGLFIDRFDQGATQTGAPSRRVDEKVLQIAGVLDLPAVPVKKVMRETQKPVVTFGHQGAEILRVIAQKARESRLIDRFGNRGLVKGQIVGPKPAPFGLVRLPQGAYPVGHALSFSLRATLVAKRRLGNGLEIVRIASGKTGPGIADTA